MYLVLVAIAWMYVAVMMTVAEIMAPNGSVLGALITFVFYGLLPLGLVGYILATPARKAKRRAREAAAQAQEASPSTQADGSDHAPSGAKQ